MNYKTIKLNIINNTAYILLNRPKRLNSFNIELCNELYDILKELRENSDVKVVVIKGAGMAFCGGGDVKEMHLADNKPKFLLELTQAIHKCVIEIRQMEKPVIAAVNGAAFGAGLSLVMACDIVIAVKEAKLSMAFINIGLAPGCGTYFATRLFGYQRACELVLTAKTFTASEALNMGLVNRLADSDELDDIITEYTSRFNQLPPLAIGKAKMLLNKSYENTLIDHLKLESITASNSAESEDFKEGVKAFVEKRKACFKGK